MNQNLYLNNDYHKEFDVEMDDFGVEDHYSNYPNLIEYLKKIKYTNIFFENKLENE